MTSLLTDNLPLLARAPNGIKKLRELILELAVRGKLVPQESNDEPASKLLKRITEEKAQLVTEGRTKKQKPRVDFVERKPASELPENWEWTSLAEVALVNPRNAAEDSLTVSFVPMTLIGARFDSAHAQEQRLWSEVKQGFTHFAEGDIGVAKITPCFENSKACVFSNLTNGLGAGTTELHVVRPIKGTLDPRYVLAYLKSPQFLHIGEAKMTGTAGQKRLPKEFVEENPFPLPPLAEQARIVAKVDELMALCDRLEAQQADSDSAHTALVQALLDSLIQASDANNFATNWHRLAEHFHTLFATESSIDALKQALLQLAVMGKLVPQDPSDEPASELLKHIEAEKLHLVRSGKFKAMKLLDSIEEVQKKFQLPMTWEWARLSEVSLQITDGAHHTPTYVEFGVPFLSVKDMSGGSLDFSSTRFVSEDEHERLIKRCNPQQGDLLLTKIGTTGVPVVVDTNRPFSIFVSVALIKAPWDFLDVNYLKLLIESPFVKQQSKDGTEGVGNKNLVLRKIANLLIAIPPLSEQHRIVVKVHELMAHCDFLKNRLTQAKKINEQLAIALVAHASKKDKNATHEPINREKARIFLAAEIVQQLHCEKRMGRVKLQKVISLAEHVARLKEIQSKEERFAAGPHDPVLMAQAVQGLRENQWFEELTLDDGKRYEYRPLAQSGTHRPAYEALWSAEQRQQISELIELMRPWDTARCERVATLYSAWNDLIIEGREANEAAILQEVLHGWNESKLKYSETQWRAELAEMRLHSFLTPTGFGKRTSGGKLTLSGFEPSI
jgi:type I restriction enzyme S subunit